MSIPLPRRRIVGNFVACCAIGLCGVVIGCGGGSSDLSDYDRMQLEKTRALDGLKSQGAKMEQKQYPQGQAWSIDLSGQNITEETFNQLKQAGYVSELNFSGSTLTDAFAAQLNTPEVRGVLVKLDISKTAFSDAGLAQLKDLNLLMELNVAGSKVTQAGIDRFKQAREANPNVMAAFKNVTIKN